MTFPFLLSPFSLQSNPLSLVNSTVILTEMKSVCQLLGGMVEGTMSMSRSKCGLVCGEEWYPPRVLSFEVYGAFGGSVVCGESEWCWSTEFQLLLVADGFVIDSLEGRIRLIWINLLGPNEKRRITLQGEEGDFIHFVDNREKEDLKMHFGLQSRVNYMSLFSCNCNIP